MPDDPETSIPRAFGRGYDAGYRRALEDAEHYIRPDAKRGAATETGARVALATIRELRRRHEELTGQE